MYAIQQSNDIIISLQKGTPEALQHLLKLYYGPLCLFANRLLKDSAAAEDVVGESFIKLWTKRANFDDLQNVKAFLYITVRHASLNYLKRQKRNALTQKQLAYLSDEKEEFVLNEMIRAEVLQVIMHEIEKLPDQCKKVAKLGYLEGLKNQQIADLLHISVHTVKNQKARAIQLLKIKLRDRDMMALLFLYFLVTHAPTD